MSAPQITFGTLTFSGRLVFAPGVVRIPRRVGIRQKLNDNPAIAVGVAAIVIAGAALVAYRTSCSNDGDEPRSGPPTKLFFTTDDSPNPKLFVDDATKVPPFDHGGKPAYRARVYRCPHGKQFVACLERFNEPERKQLQAAIDRAKALNGRAPSQDSFYNSVEVKKPGDKEWVRLSNATRERYEDVVNPVCPEGSADGVEPVLPK
jgi:hypothetical protein